MEGLQEAVDHWVFGLPAPHEIPNIGLSPEPELETLKPAQLRDRHVPQVEPILVIDIEIGFVVLPPGKVFGVRQVVVVTDDEDHDIGMETSTKGNVRPSLQRMSSWSVEYPAMPMFTTSTPSEK